MHSRLLAAVILAVLAWIPGMVIGISTWLVAGTPGTVDTAFVWALVAAGPTCLVGGVIGWRRAARRSGATGGPPSG